PQTSSPPRAAGDAGEAARRAPARRDGGAQGRAFSSVLTGAVVVFDHPARLFVFLARRDHIAPAQPALQVDVGAAARAKWAVGRVDGLAADRALAGAHLGITSKRSRGQSTCGVSARRAPKRAVSLGR